MAYGIISQGIVDLVADNPRISSVEVADRLGTSPGSVRALASRLGVKFERKTKKRGAYRPRYLSESNWKWIKAEAAKSKVPWQELIDAIVTDARLEEGDRG